MHRNRAGDLIPADTQLGGLNFVHLGPFENTKHPDCSGGCTLHTGDPLKESEMCSFVPWENALTFTCQIV